jgi:hypothetical protein
MWQWDNANYTGSAGNIAFGKDSVSRDFSVAIGQSTQATGNMGVALWSQTSHSWLRWIAIGSTSTCTWTRSIVIWPEAGDNGTSYSLSLGSYSKARRYGEVWRASDNASWDNKFWYGNVTWTYTSTDWSAHEIYLRELDNPGRFSMNYANSAIKYTLEVIAIQSTTWDTKTREYKWYAKLIWTQTYLSDNPVELIMWDAWTDSWAVVMWTTANSNLTLTVTGEASHTIKWIAKMSYVEVRT